MSHSNLAEKLRAAYQQGVISPLRDEVQTQSDAYALQEINTVYWLAQGRRLSGRKIGLTAPVVQKQLGVDEPDFGMLFEDMQIEDSGSISLENLIQPRVEAELAFVMASDLTTDDLSLEAVVEATDYLLPALEIVDSRIRDWDINICDTIADNASSALYVLGQDRLTLSKLDLPAIEMALYCDGEQVSEGRGEDCLGSPLNAMLWLAKKMVAVGRPLRAGDVVLTGAFGKMVAVTDACNVRADFQGVGSVSVSFE